MSTKLHLAHRLALLSLLVFAIPAAGSQADEKAVKEQLERSLATYKTPEAWAKRRADLRREFLAGAKLWPLPERPPVKAIVHSHREYKDYSVENVALETLPGFYCTGNLYRPLGRKDLAPAILCPHGHFRPLGRYRENHQIRCAHLARMGAAVFSYGMVGWQDSKQTTHDDPLVLALQTWNSIRAIDFLTGLERVDPGRVAVTGASGGGTQTFFASLVDDRVKVSAPLVIVYAWAAPEGCLCEGGLPVMQAAGTNAIELAAATAPRPQLLISVGNDPTAKFPNVGFPFIKQMYSVAGAADHVQNVHFADEGHDFGPSKRKRVYEFFAKQLRMSNDGFKAPDLAQPGDGDVLAEDLKQIAIEPPERMAVFDDNHPLPSHALGGSQAIGAAFETHLADLRSREASRKGAVKINDMPKAEYSFKTAGPDDEALLFTPPDFDEVGQPRIAQGADVAHLEIVVRDAETGAPTPCRVNVVGPDGHYYEPVDGDLKRHSLTGVWPSSGWGNRQGKAPIRYFGRFFYTRGDATVDVPAGTVRVEVWKGFEYRPMTKTVGVTAGATHNVELTLDRAASMDVEGYWSGDPHIHIQRRNETEERRILDLMEAESIHFGTILAYNEPAGPYAGFMGRMESPQFRGVGKRSILTRGNYSILSGQEYRSSSYGHMNLFLLDELVLKEQSLNADNWPPFGHVAAATRGLGGVAFYAHGGYAKEIYADVVQDNIDGVELLQFGVYRGIGLIDWYRMLNTGFRVPANGASDYPACRKLGDCKTYVYADDKSKPPSIEQWLAGMARGQSFITTGPLLLLDVDGNRPGAEIEFEGKSKQRVTARVRVRSEVAPVTNVQLIANGRIIHEMKVPASAGQGNWLEFKKPIELEASAWIAARAFSLSATGSPDAESHTNPVYVNIGGKAAYDRASLDSLVAAIDGQIAIHKKREFPERANVIAYFERSRDILMAIRSAGGAPAAGHPSEIASSLTTIDDPGRRTHTDEELRAFLKPLPPKPIEDVLDSFETVEGFEMQLVAREPLVHDPIAAAFDENGNLYVGEMRDYPFKPAPGGKPIGSVRLLKDIDSDGTFDESHVFADELLWVGGVAPWKGGLFVAAPPDIWYMKDTDGDNRADLRRRVFTGFGTGNQQAMLNNLNWGLDHRIYGSTAGNGGEIRYADGPRAEHEPMSVSGRDFRFDPVSGLFEAITGTVQFGNTFDDWGNRFLCSESRPLLTTVLPQHYLARNPYLPVPYALRNLTDGPVPVFRISPLERWRMIRSSRRIAAGARSPNAAGASHHVIDAAAGVTIYRGGAYPEHMYGDVFIGGAQNNLIHRRNLSADGVSFTSSRADEGTEFVRSSDNWFRPVNFVNAPDGTLYVLDMSREVLESIHVPDDVMKYLDLTSGRSHGRIYRLAPADFVYPGPPQLGTASTVELVSALESPHGWWRDTAHRLLYERQDKSAEEPLRRLLAESSSPQARLHALWSLKGLEALTDDDVLLALGDAHPALREHAMRLAEPRLDESKPILDEVIARADEDDARLRFQAAFSLGESNDSRAARALAGLAKSSAEDQWLRTAVLSSSVEQADRMLIELLSDAAFVATSAGVAMIEQFGQVIGARNQPEEIGRVLGALAQRRATNEQGRLSRRIVLAIGSGMKRYGGRFDTGQIDDQDTAAFLNNIFEEARQTAANNSADVNQRTQAIKLLSCTQFEASRDTFAESLDVQQPDAVRIKATRALSNYADAEVSALLLGYWQTYSPKVRSEVIEALLARPDRTREYLQAAKRGEASVINVPPTRRSLLLKHNDEVIRTLATELFNKTENSRAEVIADYQAALSLKTETARGEKVFRRDCMTCHKIGSIGHAIGPDLTSAASRDAQALLAHVLAPNRYLLPNYETYVLVDTNGRTFTGMITAQTATSITLTREENKADTILRANIEEIASTGRSLMPEGFEKKLTKQDMADLIAYLQVSRKPTGPAPLDIGTLPGLIEPGKKK